MKILTKNKFKKVPVQLKPFKSAFDFQKKSVNYVLRMAICMSTAIGDRSTLIGNKNDIKITRTRKAT